MNLKHLAGKTTGIALAAGAIVASVIDGAGGTLPMQLQDAITGSSSSGVTLPPATKVPDGEIFGLCTAYINHVSESGSTTTSPSSTTTTSPSSTTTTTAPATTTTAASTTTTAASTTTTSSSTTSTTSADSSVSPVLVAAAAAKGETVLQLCVSVNPEHAQLKLFSSSNNHAKIAAQADQHLKNKVSDSDNASTTTTVPSSTTTTSGSSTTTSSTLDDHANDNSQVSDNAKTEVKSSDESSKADTSSKDSVDANLHAHLNINASTHNG